MCTWNSCWLLKYFCSVNNFLYNRGGSKYEGGKDCWQMHLLVFGNGSKFLQSILCENCMCHAHMNRGFWEKRSTLITTPLKINMEHKNYQIEKENHLPNLHVWVPINFPACINRLKSC